MEGRRDAVSSAGAATLSLSVLCMTHGSEKRVRNRHLTVRLSDEERAAIDQAAEAAGLMPGSYARQVMLGGPAPRPVHKSPVERQELVRLLGQLGHIGGNLNQIAKSLNTGVVVYESEIGAALRAVTAMRDAVMLALGREP
ncbi:MAG: plasmid mobilization relaxosome protein MobC [Rhizomicrobium sp.]